MGAAASLAQWADPAQQQMWDRLQAECHGVTPPVGRNADEAAAVRDELAAKYKVHVAAANAGGDETAAAEAAFAKLREDYIDACIGKTRTTPLQALDQMVDTVVYTSDGRWPLVWDPSGQAAKFFKQVSVVLVGCWQ